MNNKGFTAKNHRVGHRVEIPPHYDLWMRGARFGVVVSTNSEHGLTKVRMDHPQVRRLVTVHTSDLKFV